MLRPSDQRVSLVDSVYPYPKSIQAFYNVLVIAVMLICLTSLTGHLAGLENLYTWGLPWAFSTPTGINYFLIVAYLTAPESFRRWFLYGAGFGAVAALAFQMEGYSIATGFIQVSLVLSLLFRNRGAKYFFLAIGMWSILIGLTHAVLAQAPGFFSPYIRNLSLPTMITGLMLITIAFSENPKVPFSLKSFSRKDIGTAVFLLFIWVLLTYSVKTESAGVGFSIIATMVTALAILLHYSYVVLQKKEKYHQQMKDGIDRSTIAVITDHKGVILSANDHFCEVSGFTRDE
jgi:hypothetical protein